MRRRIRRLAFPLILAALVLSSVAVNVALVLAAAASDDGEVTVPREATTP